MLQKVEPRGDRVATASDGLSETVVNMSEDTLGVTGREGSHQRGELVLSVDVLSESVGIEPAIGHRCRDGLAGKEK